MRVRLLCDAIQQPAVSLTWPAFLLRQDSLPSSIVCLLDCLLFLLVCYERTLDCNFGRVVAIEEGGVDFNTGDLATCSA